MNKTPLDNPLSLVQENPLYANIMELPESSKMPKQAYLFNPPRKSV